MSVGFSSVFCSHGNDLYCASPDRLEPVWMPVRRQLSSSHPLPLPGSAEINWHRPLSIAAKSSPGP